MKFISDLHLHGRFAQACSKTTTLGILEKWAKTKGVDVLATGDFAHPIWQSEIKDELKDEHDTGIYRSKTGFPFVLEMEISLIYTHLGKGRRVHHIILAPSIEVVDQITEYLKSHGRVDYDGRPIFNITSEQLVSDLRSISTDIEVIPAHIWTPWFAMFGSKSGYNSLKECFGSQAKHIHAIETGMSSDPQMNWRIPEFDDRQIVSFSDAHSPWPWRLGREATIFEMNELSYTGILRAIRTAKGLAGTIETEPAYGKYHWDGHRKCNVSFSPVQSKEHNRMCPECRKPLTLGVEYRVEELAKRPSDYVRKDAPAYWKLLPLHEMISSVSGKAMTTKSVWTVYNKLTQEFGSENDVLLKTPMQDLRKVISEPLVKTIMANREQRITVEPGYDGEYGQIKLVFLKDSEIEDGKKNLLKKVQKGLHDFF